MSDNLSLDAKEAGDVERYNALHEEAINAYLKAIELKPDYFDANFNLGALYFNEAVQGITLADDMWKPRMTKAESAAQKQLETDAKALLEIARPYLEAAHATDSSNIEVMRSLRDVYTRTGNDEMMLEMSTQIKAASN